MNKELNREQMLSIISEEIDNYSFVPELQKQALEQAAGNIAQARLIYVELRMEQLRQEFTQKLERHQQDWEKRQKEFQKSAEKEWKVRKKERSVLLKPLDDTVTFGDPKPSSSQWMFTLLFVSPILFFIILILVLAGMN